MKTEICIFEPHDYDKLLPLVWFRAVFDLRCGIVTLRQKIERTYPGHRVSVLCRSYLAPVLEELYPQLVVNRLPDLPVLLVDGRLIAHDAVAGTLEPHAAGSRLYTRDSTVVAARLESQLVGRLRERIASRRPEGLDLASLLAAEALPKVEVDVDLVEHPWDLISRNPREIARDAARLPAQGHDALHATVVTLGDPVGLHVGEGAVVDPGAVLDLRQGPVVIGEGAAVGPHAVLQGPVSVGEGSVVRPHAKVLHETTIGPVCKVGGEIEASIVHGHSNKQHHGFLGHSYVGEWVNLGAGTSNSDLKNTYGEVQVEVAGRRVSTGSLFAGLFMGDHSKTGINVSLNTGCLVGVCSNLFGTALLPKSVPSFIWGGDGGFEVYECEKSMAVARRAMGRRNRELTAAEERMFREVFARSQGERRDFLVF